MQLSCPHCQYRLLDPVHYESIEIDVCRQCGGEWFDNNELERIIKARHPELRNDMRLEFSMDSSGEPTSRPCPHCKSLLVEHSLVPDLPPLVDVCLNGHGVWLEHLELDQAIHEVRRQDALDAIGKPINVKIWLFQFLTRMPVEFNIPPRKPAYMTMCLIALNALVFAYMVSSDDPDRIVELYALYPNQFLEWNWFLTLVTSQFLHGGLWHLVGNMYFLHLVGDNVEDAYGAIYFLMAYLFIGICGGVLQTALSSQDMMEVPIVGASGAVAGIMAMYAYLFRKAKLTFMVLVFQFKLSAVWYFGIWISINLIGALFGLGGIAWYAHLGGFAAGLLLAALTYQSCIRRNPFLAYLNRG